MSWNQQDALARKRARTRDGRDVFELREAVLDGKPVLVGAVATRRVVGDWIVTELAYWGRNGLGVHGGDDLVDFIPKPPKRASPKRAVRTAACS